jgi:hypothetical protein
LQLNQREAKGASKTTLITDWDLLFPMEWDQKKVNGNSVQKYVITVNFGN